MEMKRKQKRIQIQSKGALIGKDSAMGRELKQIHETPYADNERFWLQDKCLTKQVFLKNLNLYFL